MPTAKRYKRWKDEGRCMDCGRERDRPGKTVCSVCWGRRVDKYRALRDEVIDMYGARCACCGETERMFLSLDHVNNNGWEERRGHSNMVGYKRAKQYPNEYQVLCHNCNHGRYLNGGICPHNSHAPG